MRDFIKRAFLFFFFTAAFIFSFVQKSNATHIVGGELYYRNLGNNDYEITLIVYRDCVNGVPPFDQPASVGIFDAVTHNLVLSLNMFSGDSTYLPNQINDSCRIPPTNICYVRAKYKETVHIPPNVNGYILSYQRCCRNFSIVNITNPLSTGATDEAFIPGSGVVTNNSNPVYTNLPPSFICANKQFIFDNSATDANGDSIVYEMCTPFTGADTISPEPQPPNNPPYQTVNYINPPYSTANMLNGIAGGQPLAIDPHTGLLTAVPNTIGQFVIGVCAKEYRNGVYLSTTRRDYQLNVVPCPSIVVAALQTPITVCGSLAVGFSNGSFGASQYWWNFGVTTTLSDTSVAVSPSYVYPDTGTYSVILVAYSNINTSCTDTAFGTVHLWPDLTTDYTYAQQPCSYTVNFHDTITNNTGTLGSVSWNFGDNSTSVVSNPSHTYSFSGTYIVTLITQSSRGCKDTVQKTLVIPPLVTANAGARTVLCHGDCNGIAYTHPVNGTPGYTFMWNNSQASDTIKNLCPGTYTVTVTDSNGCTNTQTVIVAEPSALALSATATPAYCHGRCIGSATASPSGGNGSYVYHWSNGTTTSSIKNLCQGIYTVTVTDINGCTVAPDSVEVLYSDYVPPLSVSADRDTIYAGETVNLYSTVYNGYAYTWTPSSTLNNSTIPNPIASPTAPNQFTNYYLTINDSNNCPNSDSLRIYVRETICREPNIFIPNAFTPNGDKENDVLYVRGYQIKQLLFRVYDRWGEKVFETTTPGAGWDGMYKGTLVTPGVFVYYLDATCFNNEKFFKKGNVTVIR
jgi:gliding motility-associated-like protein